MADKTIRKGPSSVPPAEDRQLGKAGWMCLAAIVLAAVGLRGAYLAEAIHKPDFTHPSLDPLMNDYLARGIAFGDWTPPEGKDDPRYGETPYGRPPGYPYFLAAVYKFTGGSHLAPRLVQMLFGVANILLAFFLARAVFGKAAGLIAAGLMAVYWAFIYFEAELNYPALIIFLALLLMALLRSWLLRPHLAKALAAGVLFGLFALIRPNVLLVEGAVIAWMLWAGARQRIEVRRLLKALGLLLAGTAVMLAPAFIRNYAVARDIVLVSYYGGVNAYIGNNPETQGTSPDIPDIREIAGMDSWDCFAYPELVRNLGKTLGKEDLKFSEASNYFLRRALAFIAQHPAKAAGLTLRKTLLFWGPKEISDSKVVHYERARSPILRFLPGFPFALASAVLGLVLFIAKRRSNKGPAPEGSVEMFALFITFILAYFACVLPFFIAGRYRVAVIPFLLMLGAYGIASTAGMFQRGEHRKGAIWTALGLGLFALAHVPLVPYQPKLATWHYHRAEAFSLDGAHTQAVEELEAALQADPGHAKALNRLGYEWGELGEPGKALPLFRKAVEAGPNNAFAHNNLGYQLAQQGDTAAAEREYREALRLDPGHTLALTNLGNLLSGAGRPGEAIPLFEQVLERTPGDPHAHYNLGNAYARQGNLGKAIPHFEQALKDNPDNPDIPNNLGLAYALQGQFDKALECYRQALSIDPTYAKAHFNIGNILGEQGHYDQAIAAYEMALALAPGFEQAQKNLNAVRERQGQP